MKQTKASNTWKISVALKKKQKKKNFGTQNLQNAPPYAKTSTNKYQMKKKNPTTREDCMKNKQQDTVCKAEALCNG